jgi:hypothetical protein
MVQPRYIIPLRALVLRESDKAVDAFSMKIIEEIFIKGCACSLEAISKIGLKNKSRLFL